MLITDPMLTRRFSQVPIWTKIPTFSSSSSNLNYADIHLYLEGFVCFPHICTMSYGVIANKNNLENHLYCSSFLFWINKSMKTALLADTEMSWIRLSSSARGTYYWFHACLLSRTPPFHITPATTQQLSPSLSPTNLMLCFVFSCPLRACLNGWRWWMHVKDTLQVGYGYKLSWQGGREREREKGMKG